VRERGERVTIVFDWMGRKSEPWSLVTLKLPWGTAIPVRNHHQNPRTPLPEEDSGARIRWLQPRSMALWVTMPDAVMGRKT
jgi:hypothetical protein